MFKIVLTGLWSYSVLWSFPCDQAVVVTRRLGGLWNHCHVDADAIGACSTLRTVSLACFESPWTIFAVLVCHARCYSPINSHIR